MHPRQRNAGGFGPNLSVHSCNRPLGSAKLTFWPALIPPAYPFCWNIMMPPTEKNLDASSPPLRPTGKLLTKLRQLVRHNSRRWKTVILFEALGLAVAAPLGYLWLVLVLEYQLQLPLAGR